MKTEEIKQDPSGEKKAGIDVPQSPGVRQFPGAGFACGKGGRHPHISVIVGKNCSIARDRNGDGRSESDCKRH